METKGNMILNQIEVCQLVKKKICKNQQIAESAASGSKLVEISLRYR
jgi:hypothetical protein